MINRLLPELKERIVGRLRGGRSQSKGVYFSHPNLEISLLPHDAPTAVFPRNDKEVLILRNAWYPDDVGWMVERLSKQIGDRGRNIHFLSNTEELHKERLKWGLNSHFVNINCFIDENIFTPKAPPEAKLYDAVAVARFSWHKLKELKRHYLMTEIESLALLDPIHGTTDQKYKQKYCSRSNCKYYNQKRLSAPAVNRILQQSHCGLILSAHEGACRACCEYLAAGIPVVSTPSTGGRDVWFDDYNSIIVEPNAKEVKKAVEFFKNHPRDPEIIRENFLKKARIFRERFKHEIIAPILREHHINTDMDDFIRQYPFFWWPGERVRHEMGTSHIELEFGDFSAGNISPKVIDHILYQLKRGSTVLEFGSGLSSRELSKLYRVTSIEHDPRFLNRYHDRYIFSELQEDQHYREADCRGALSTDYDLVLVDGPPSYRHETRKSRLGFQKYVDLLGEKTVVVVDDVHRLWDCTNLLKTFIRLKSDLVVIKDGKKRCGILTREPWTLRAYARLAYLLLGSILYPYDR